MNPLEIVRRFTYHAPHGEQPKQYDRIRASVRSVAEMINAMCPENREKALAMTNLEEAVMWANASIARGKGEE